MHIRKWVILITIFLVVNTYYEGKYTDYLIAGKKYYKMILYGFIGLSIYMFIKKVIFNHLFLCSIFLDTYY